MQTLTAIGERLSKEKMRDSFTEPHGDHRMQLVSIQSGVRYINDSKATNENATWYALENTEGPIIWIVGGGLAHSNWYWDLEEVVRKKVKAIILIGNHTLDLEKAFRKHLVKFKASSMRESVHIARTISCSGDSVLLSPACASFDMFENYVDRGNQFIQEVNSR